ncbi:MAG: hypothetical protein JXD22_11625 [Sedimentisphaerales bacterium]|nr:hypothetical protein [Sedimentisphaerales bacterium]
MQMVIPTKGRADIIGKMSLRLFPDATLCVGDDEVDQYSRHTKNLLVHPAALVGMGPLRQWILDNVADPCVVMIDDDISVCYSQVGFHKRRIEDPAEVQAIVERLGHLAQDIGDCVFGFAQSARPMAYANFSPFSLDTWVGTVAGMNGRSLSYDTRLMLRGEDIDLTLQALLHHRFVLAECRYYFAHAMFKLKGGNAVNRSSERHRAETEYMLKKWRGHLVSRETKGGADRLVVRVKRK